MTNETVNKWEMCKPESCSVTFNIDRDGKLIDGWEKQAEYITLNFNDVAYTFINGGVIAVIDKGNK